MKRAWAVAVIIFMILILGAISLTLKQNKVKDSKYCNTNEDCVVKYNMFYNGQCDAGCFNKDSKTDETCDKALVWEDLGSDSRCKCIEKTCEYSIYECPNTPYLDCMPMTTPETHPWCYGEYHNWLVQNCNITFSV